MSVLCCSTSKAREMVFTEYTKRRIVFYEAKGCRAPNIMKLFQEEGIDVSSRGVSAFFARVEQTGDIARRPGSGRPSKRTDEVKDAVERAMREDDETTAKELHKKLTIDGHSLSLKRNLIATLFRYRKKERSSKE